MSKKERQSTLFLELLIRHLSQLVPEREDVESVLERLVFLSSNGYIKDLTVSNVSNHDAYGSQTIEFKEGFELTFLNTEGDQDADELFIESVVEGEESFDKNALGFSFIFEGFIYCIDIGIDGSIGKLFKSTEQIKQAPEFYTGKRAFYHYRKDSFISLRGLSSLDKEHEEARDWISGPRSLYHLSIAN